MPITPTWMESVPESLADKTRLIQEHKSYLSSPGRKGKFLRRILKEVNREFNEVKEAAQQQDPLAFFKPSYEQALILNCWIYGIAFIGVYTANRIGKTTACIINFLLWIFPNSPQWKISGIFKPYRVGDETNDLLNADNPNAGKLVQVLPRPDIATVAKINKWITHNSLKPDPMVPHYEEPNRSILAALQQQHPDWLAPAFPYPPWNQGGECWMGAPDHAHHKQKIMPIWKKYIPSPFLLRYVPTEQEITIEVPGPTRKTCWNIIGLSFEQKETKWASGAVEAILITEGITPDVFKEAKLRFTTPGIGSHDFTPYDPANTNGSVALAQRIKSGKDKLPLPTFVFEGFSVFNAPKHILPEDKRLGLIESFKDDIQGTARLHGKFYTSSGLVLSNLSRDIHLLPLTPGEMFKMFPDGQIFRGLDPGLDHPTSCCWAYLLPSGQFLIYRILSERGMDIPTRCERIIKLSNNHPAKIKFGPGERDFYIKETHPNADSEIPVLTPTDYHTFKEDESTGQAYSLNYITNGLVIHPSCHTGPEERALLVNSALKVSPFYPDLKTYVTHLQRLQNKALPKTKKPSPPISSLQCMPCDRDILGLQPPVPPGPKVYFLQYGPGIMSAIGLWEEFYWTRTLQGENKGQPKDKIPEHGDDELDAMSYIICGNYVWTRFKPQRIIINDSEPEQELIEASQNLERKRIIIPTMAQANYFGSPGGATLDDDDRDHEVY